MPYADAKHIEIAEIPVIDAAPLTTGESQGLHAVAKELRQAAETSGFFYVVNHGIPADLIERVFEVSRAFFHADPARKREVRISDHHRGLLEVGQAKMEGQAKIDLKESYIWGPDVGADNPDFLAGNIMLPPNNWPRFLPEMRPVLNDYLAAANDCGKRLLRAFAASLGIEVDHFAQHFSKPISRGSLVYYPPQPEAMGNEQFGVSPHTDYGTLTLVAQDKTGGLRVRGRGGDWLTAHPIEGTLVVNVGDLLARWTNDRFQSTPHAVVNASGQERFSVAVFVDPDWDTEIRPVVLDGDRAKYEPVRCADYVRERFDKAFAYRQKAPETTQGES